MSALAELSIDVVLATVCHQFSSLGFAGTLAGTFCKNAAKIGKNWKSLRI